MNNIVNRLITLFRSTVIDGIVEDGSRDEVLLEENYLDLPDFECLWFLSYQKHKPLLLSLKLGEERSLRQIARPLAEKLAEIAPGALVVPLPESNRRILLRGHNHTLLIADAAMKHSKQEDLRIEKRNLIKIRETRKQAKLSRSERRKEQKGVFRLRRPERILGKTVFLLDDIVTTGSTLSEARQVLLKGGAERVICVALAH